MMPGRVEVMIEEAEITKRISELGDELSRRYEGQPLTLVCVLKGAMPFFGRLCTAVSVPVWCDFISASSYHGGTESSGTVLVRVEPSSEMIRDRDVVLVEDIVDTGLTITALRERILEQGARSVAVVTLLDKPSRRKVPLVPDFIGFSIPDAFVIGYGLDLDEYYRNLPFIGLFVPET